LSAIASAPAIPIAFTPALQGEDPLGNYWLQQVTTRLRREICWLWQERGALVVEHPGSLPPFSHKLSTALDLTRYAQEKQQFFATDETAHYLTSLLNAPPPDETDPPRGSFTWVARELELDDAACFVFALGLLPVVDSAAGTVMAACLNDAARTYPTLALAQRLWDDPEKILALSDPAHSLFRFGLLHGLASSRENNAGSEWEAPLELPAVFARLLLFRDRRWPRAFRRISIEPGDEKSLPPEAKFFAARLRAASLPYALCVVPIVGNKGAPLREVAAAIASLAGRPVVEVEFVQASGAGQSLPGPLPTLAWLHGLDLFVSGQDELCGAGDAKHHAVTWPVSRTLPLTLFFGLEDKTWLRRLPSAGRLPAIMVEPMSFQDRHDRWRDRLSQDSKRIGAAFDNAIAECARRFRCERDTIDTIASELLTLDQPLCPDDLTAACRAEVTADIGELAQAVVPRFGLKELMLPAKQSREIREIIKAMQALGCVHYEWGTARAWNESGLCALFAGPPGTGKTMAAEVIAAELQLPLYRIDLSQVVNKYIGETEKNLRRLFDAADACDVILFFDEADALFGKRTEVKDSHDRYANLEISYLLERMERFKGLAVLATNRKQDLDEAFLRRLRFVIDFPLPGEEERRRIWLQMMPPHAEPKEIDFDFLARQFPLAGGHIRSIVFNAGLQSADANDSRILTMPAVLTAIRSEYDKLKRSLSVEQFGRYQEILKVP
jgi:hypothetical protein